MNVLYHAYSLTDDNKPFVFELKEIPIKRVGEGGTIELKYPIFYGVMDCSDFIDGSSEVKTGTEYSVGNSSVYYSTSYDNCMKFLVQKREEIYEKYKKLKYYVDDMYKEFSRSGIKKCVSFENNGKQKYSLWMEGYDVTGGHSDAEYLGEFEGHSFNEACDNWAKTCSDPTLYSPGTEERIPTYWACRIFDNEMDARKAFG